MGDSEILAKKTQRKITPKNQTDLTDAEPDEKKKKVNPTTNPKTNPNRNQIKTRKMKKKTKRENRKKKKKIREKFRFWGISRENRIGLPDFMLFVPVWSDHFFMNKE